MSPRAFLRAAVLTSFVTAACGESVQPEIPAFSATPDTQWSGGVIALRSSFFVGRQQLPLITSGTGDTLSLTRQDDSTLISTLPLGPSGPVTLAMQTGSRSYALAGVQRVGFRDIRTVAVPAFQGLLEANNAGGIPFVFGALSTYLTCCHAPIVRLDVVAGQSVVLAPTLRQPDQPLYGMAPSITPGVFVVRDSTDSLRMAQLSDDVPVVTGTVPQTVTGGVRQVSQLSSGIWMFTASHFTQIKRESDGSIITQVLSESPYRVFISPRGDRTTMTTVVNVDGVPVFDNATGTVAFRLPFLDIRAGAFSPDGATLFVAGGNQYLPDSLVAVNATTGTVQIPKVRLPGGLYAMGIVFRPAADQLLVGATDTYHPGNPTTLHLLVYRASTLELLGILPSSFACGELDQGERCHNGAITLDEVHGIAYIVPSSSPTPMVAFDLLVAP